jgi:hypothetical protein
MCAENSKSRGLAGGLIEIRQNDMDYAIKSVGATGQSFS